VRGHSVAAADLYTIETARQLRRDNAFDDLRIVIRDLYFVHVALNHTNHQSLIPNS